MQIPPSNSIKRTAEGQEYYLVTGLPWPIRILLALPLIAMTLLPPIPQPWSFIVAVLFTGLVIYEYNKNQLNNQPGHEMVQHWAMWAYIALLPASLIAFLLLDSFAHLLLAAFILVTLSLIFTSRVPWRTPMNTVR